MARGPEIYINQLEQIINRGCLKQESKSLIIRINYQICQHLSVTTGCPKQKYGLAHFGVFDLGKGVFRD